MATHIDFVAALFIVWGVLTALIGLSMMALGIGAVAIIASANRTGSTQVAAGLTAATFATLAVIAIVWGTAHVLVGVPLRRRRPWARLLALMLGAVDVLLLPYGTAVGCYAMWALLDGEKGYDALLRRVDRASRCPGTAACHPADRFPPAADHAVAGDDDLGVAAARWCESAAQADPSGDWRDASLIRVNAGDRDRLRVDRDQRDDGGGKESGADGNRSAAKTGPHTR